MFDVSENGIVQWMKLINEELSLIKGLMDSDVRRYRDLK